MQNLFDVPKVKESNADISKVTSFFWEFFCVFGLAFWAVFCYIALSVS